MTQSVLHYITAETEGSSLEPRNETGVVVLEAETQGTMGRAFVLGASSEHRRQRQRNERVVRRLDGVLLEVVNENARVVLVDGGEKYEYWLPAGDLQQSGVTEAGQPFEMDEFERIEEQEYTKGYRYRAVARPNDAYPETIDLDAEHKSKLKAIIAGWKHAED